MNLADWSTKKADAYRVPSEIIHAIGQVETGRRMDSVTALPDQTWVWDVSRRRPFRRLSAAELQSYSPPEDFPGKLFGPTGMTGIIAPTAEVQAGDEWLGQRLGWGPFALSGAVARRWGFSLPFPVLCSDPEQAALWVCVVLSHLRDRYFDRHGWAGVVSAYRFGRPRRGVDGLYVNSAYVTAVGKAGALRRY